VGTKAGKTLSQLSVQEPNEKHSPALLSLEKCVSRIEGLLSNFSPVVKDEAVTWTCPEDKHPSPELQKMWMEMVWEREVHPPQERIPVNPSWTVSDNDSLYVKERRRSWKEPDRRQRPERRENNRRALERLPISGTPNDSSTDTKTPSDSLLERVGTRTTEHDGYLRATQQLWLPLGKPFEP
jgi:hypothetical protein